jgi:hypothetical protein
MTHEFNNSINLVDNSGNITESMSAPAGENRFAIFIVTMVASAASISVIGLATGARGLIPWLIGWAALLSIWRGARIDRPRGAIPPRTFLEYFLATLAAVFSYEVFLNFGFVAAAFVFWLLKLVQVISGWLGAGWQITPWTPALWTATLIAIPALYGATSLAFDKARLQLFPPKISGPSAFYEMAVLGRRDLIKVIAINVGAVAAAWLLCFRGRTITGFWTFLAIYLAGCAVQVYEVGDPSSTERKAVDVLVALFQALGCKVIRDPKTENASADRILRDLDLVAYTEQHAWGVSVKAADAGAQDVEWIAGAGLLSAVRAYREQKTEFAGIEPVMVLVGAKADPNLATFARDEGMIVHLILKFENLSPQKPILPRLPEELFLRDSPSGPYQLKALLYDAFNAEHSFAPPQMSSSRA